MNSNVDSYCSESSKNFLGIRKQGDIRIVHAKPCAIRVRKVVSRSNARPTTKFASVKMCRMMQAESDGELAAFRLFDTDRSVKAFHEQPMSIFYWMHGQLRRHDPDILVERHEQTLGEVNEVKTAKDALRPEIAERTSYLMENLPRFGFTYRLLISENLKRHPFLKSANALRYHSNGVRVGELAREQIRTILEANKFITWAAAEKGTIGRFGRSVLSRLTLEGFLDFDRSRPLDSATRFYLATPQARGLSL
jgi:hypothetical protein